MAVGTTLSASVPTTLSWLGHDDLSGICRYSIHQQVNSGAVTSPFPARPTNTSMARGLVPSTNVYHFAVQATDCSDNTSGFVNGPTARVVMHQNAGGGIKYTGTWHSLRSPGTSGGTIHSTSKKGSSASLKFLGRQIAWVASKSKARGQAAVYIDGKHVRNVNLYSKTLIRKRIVFTYGWAANGTHTIKIVCLGTKGHPAVNIDALINLR